MRRFQALVAAQLRHMDREERRSTPCSGRTSATTRSRRSTAASSPPSRPGPHAGCVPMMDAVAEPRGARSARRRPPRVTSSRPSAADEPQVVDPDVVGGARDVDLKLDAVELGGADLRLARHAPARQLLQRRPGEDERLPLGRQGEIGAEVVEALARRRRPAGRCSRRESSGEPCRSRPAPRAPRTRSRRSPRRRRAPWGRSG